MIKTAWTKFKNYYECDQLLCIRNKSIGFLDLLYYRTFRGILIEFCVFFIWVINCVLFSYFHTLGKYNESINIIKHQYGPTIIINNSICYLYTTTVVLMF